MRMMWDTVAMLDEGALPLRRKYCFQPMMRPGEMQESFIAQGLADVEETSLLIRMEYLSFEDYWGPIAAGEGPLVEYLAGLKLGEAKGGGIAIRPATRLASRMGRGRSHR